MLTKKDQIPILAHKRPASDDIHSFWSKSKLDQYLDIEKDRIPHFQNIHRDIEASLPEEFPHGMYEGVGIVFVGGDQFSWLTLLGVQSLRSTGCSLPIEVIINGPEDYEYQFCEEMLPALNAKCIKVYDLLGVTFMKDVGFKGYQYKSLALIASSFEDVLLLDSDNIPISNPQGFFEEEPYKSFGLVTWPDYWERTSSPHLYEVLDMPVNETIKARDGSWTLNQAQKVMNLSEVKYHDLEGTLPNPSTESGQLLIRKSDHVKTMLLSLFYNLYGPGFYYRLLSMGAAGEGDKDTFILAAVKSNEPYYQVRSGIRTFGWFDQGNFNGIAMGQRDPVIDYNQACKFLKKDHPDFEEFNAQITPIFTVHCNTIKLNPVALMHGGKTKNSKGEEVRVYHDLGNFLPAKFDFEKVQFEKMKLFLCDLNLAFKCFNNIKRVEICEFVEGHLEFLQEHPMEF
jgi:alpha 1,2-mannosyltransferase